MSNLVGLIVLSYLLVIALCVTVWSAVSLRQSPSSRDTAAGDGSSQGGKSTTSTSASRREAGQHTHDAYRGAKVPAASETRVRETRVRETRTKLPPVDDSRDEPERSATTQSELRDSREPKQRRNEDAFERFLRANDDY